MSLKKFIETMPKVEIHVHLEGATQPETVLHLAEKNKIELPVKTIEEMRDWYEFRDFEHFVDIYLTASKCITSPEDIEYIAREFLKGQSQQNIVYSEVTYTAYTHYTNYGISFADQFAALTRANEWAKLELGVSMGIVVDIVRNLPAELGTDTAKYFLQDKSDIVVAFGIGGSEAGNPAKKHAEAMNMVLSHGGIPIVPHAGETAGADSIWDAIEVCKAIRIGHGVRCLEDEKLVVYLREHQIPLEVNPTSNIQLGVFPSIETHPIQQLIDAGLYVTVNSDDPPMFNTTLTEEFIKCTETFKWDPDRLQWLTMNALNATFLDDDTKAQMRTDFESQFKNLKI